MIPTRSIGSGAGRLRFTETPGFTVDVTFYPPGFALAEHVHERANLCVVLEGGLTEWAGRRERVYRAATLVAKPPGEPHSDRFHERGARCLNVALEHDRLAWIHDEFPAIAEVQVETDPILITAGRRMSVELGRPDDLSPLVVEALALELVAGTVRAARRRRRRASPDWVAQARDFLHDRFTCAVSLADVAAAVDRHPVSLAQQFRRRYGVSVGEYVRHLRVEHVARRLVTGRAPLAEIAADAGFADQSHMQRVFKTRLGVTPAEYRRLHG